MTRHGHQRVKALLLQLGGADRGQVRDLGRGVDLEGGYALFGNALVEGVEQGGAAHLGSHEVVGTTGLVLLRLETVSLG